MKGVVAYGVIGATVLVCLAIANVPMPDGTPPTAMPALALTLFAVTMWATGALPEYVAALVFFLAASVFAVAPGTAIFAGFQTSAWWLVFSGLVIGAAADNSGLGQWVARHAFRHAGLSYGGLITAVLVGAIALCFIVPSSVGRMAIAIPAVTAIAVEAGHKPGSRGHDGAIVAVVFGTFLFTYGVLPANLINILLAGTAESMLGVNVTYGEFMLMNLPVATLAKAAVAWLLLIWMFRPEAGGRPVETSGPKPLSRDGRVLLVVVLLTLLAWSTDFLHGVQSGWVALAAALVCLLPGIGLVSGKLFAERVTIGTLLFVGSVLAVGPVLSESGAGALISKLVAGNLPLDQMSPATAYFAISYISALTSMLANITGSVAIVTPMAADFANATGLPLKAAALAQINGLGALFFPYEALPLMVGLAMGGVPVARVVKFCIALALASVLILTPLNFLWWRLLGYIPG